MKPVVIIVVSVVCSVVAVLAVLTAMDLYAINQVNQALEKEAEYQKSIERFLKQGQGCYTYQVIGERRGCLADARDDLYNHLRNNGEAHMYETYIGAYPHMCFEHSTIFGRECN